MSSFLVKSPYFNRTGRHINSPAEIWIYHQMSPRILEAPPTAVPAVPALRRDGFYTLISVDIFRASTSILEKRGMTNFAGSGQSELS